MTAGLEPFGANRVSHGPIVLAGDPQISAALSAAMARIEAICQEAKRRSSASQGRSGVSTNPNRE